MDKAELREKIKLCVERRIRAAQADQQEGQTMSQEQLANLVDRLEKVTSRLENVSKGSADAQSDEEPLFVKEFGESINDPLNRFMTCSEQIGGLVNDQAQFLKKAIAAQYDYLVIASKSRKPRDQTVIAELLKPTSDNLSAIMELKEKNRRSDLFNHLSALAEGVGALGWVTIEPTPVSYIVAMADAGMFYVNRVLKEYKDKGQVHSDWTNSLVNLWKKLQVYVKQYHTTGLSWNVQGGDATSATVSASPPAGAVPPPPPSGGLPPPPPMGATPAAKSVSVPDTTALFSSINKGGDITKGLKKVSDDMKTHKNLNFKAALPLPGLKKVSDGQKTHKNPALRQGPAPFKPTAAPKPSSKPKPAVSTPVAKHPLVELQGKKWVVEYLNNSHDTVISDVNNKQTVYVYKCVNATVQIKGKVNSITLDSCKKTSVVFDDAISMVDFVNCQSVKAQVMGKVPTVSIEKTDGCQVYLSKDSLDTSFISAKSSEMNVVVPTADGDYTEFAIAEQFRTVFNGKTLETTVNDIAA